MWYLILGLLGLLYLASNTILPSQGTIGTYLLQPLLWIGLAILTLLVAKNEDLNILKFKRVSHWYFGNSPLQAGLLIGGLQVTLLILVGVFTGFGKSPNSFTPTPLILNLVFVASLLTGTEITRAYLIKRGTQTRRHTTLVLIAATVIYAAFQLTITQILTLTTNTPIILLEFLGKTVITAIAINLLASYLSYMGGATASLSYIGILTAFDWFSPILPNPHWTILALIGTIIPAIGYSLIQNSIREPGIKKHRKPHRTTADGYGWTAVTVFSVLIVFFSFGYLGVKPTVIYSGSMQPELQVGDLAIIQKTDPATLKNGDIIQFNNDNMTLIHRVINITSQQGQTLYTTKGDANKDPDIPPIKEDQIIGKSIFTIPKIGWIQILVKDLARKAGIKV